MKNKGFTLIELLIVVGILAVLIGAIAAAINPMKQFAKANNARRNADIMNIMNAVSQNIVDGKGNWTCSGKPLPTSTTYIANTTTADYATYYDLCSCIVPGYVGAMPVDPSSGTWGDNCASAYHAYYRIKQDPTTHRITIDAPSAQAEDGSVPTISITR